LLKRRLRLDHVGQESMGDQDESAVPIVRYLRVQLSDPRSKNGAFAQLARSVAKHPRALTGLRSGYSRRVGTQRRARGEAAPRRMARVPNRCIGTTLLGGKGGSTSRVHARHRPRHQKRTRRLRAALLTGVWRVELRHRPQHRERSAVGAKVIVNRHATDPARAACPRRP
jgi:hypothetical protein